MESIGLNPKFTITNRIAAGLTLIERARGFLEAATLSENWIREMGNRVKRIIMKEYKGMMRRATHEY
jgi:hypothetical protein